MQVKATGLRVLQIRLPGCLIKFAPAFLCLSLDALVGVAEVTDFGHVSVESNVTEWPYNVSLVGDQRTVAPKLRH